jgi:excisionase family DNA binding protein
MSSVVHLFNEYLKASGEPVAAALLVLSDTLHSENNSYTVKDAATRLKLCSKTVYQMCQSGRIQCFRAGRSVRIPAAEIKRLEDEQAPCHDHLA